MLEYVRCQVLNASYEPLSVVSARRALVQVLKGKATILSEHASYTIASGNDIFPVPTQILLKTMVKAPPTTRKPAQLTQRNLFIRDRYTCQYCGRHKSQLDKNEKLTRDHVHPQDKGGQDVWTNVVTACNRCNHKKANYVLSDLQMKLIKEPTTPTVFEIWSKSGTKKYQ